MGSHGRGHSEKTNTKIVETARELIRETREIDSGALLFQLSQYGCGNIYIHPATLSKLIRKHLKKVIRIERRIVNGRKRNVYIWK